MKSIVIGVLLLSGCALLGGGGSAMNASPAIPAVEGHAKFGRAPNGNTSVDVTVKHLADPEKLTPPANTYVVWLRPNKDAAPQNHGQRADVVVQSSGCPVGACWTWPEASAVMNRSKVRTRSSTAS